jgi:hypothetical protein
MLRVVDSNMRKIRADIILDKIGTLTAAGSIDAAIRLRAASA